MATSTERVNALMTALYQMEHEISDIGATASLTHWTERQRLEAARQALEQGRLHLTHLLLANPQLAYVARQDRERTQILWNATTPPARRHR